MLSWQKLRSLIAWKELHLRKHIIYCVIILYFQELVHLLALQLQVLWQADMNIVPHNDDNLVGTTVQVWKVPIHIFSLFPNVVDVNAFYISRKITNSKFGAFTRNTHLLLMILILIAQLGFVSSRLAIIQILLGLRRKTKDPPKWGERKRVLIWKICVHNVYGHKHCAIIKK